MVNIAAATRATSSGLLNSGGSARPSAKAEPAAKPTTAALTTVNALAVAMIAPMPASQIKLDRMKGQARLSMRREKAISRNDAGN